MSRSDDEDGGLREGLSISLMGYTVCERMDIRFRNLVICDQLILDLASCEESKEDWVLRLRKVRFISRFTWFSGRIRLSDWWISDFPFLADWENTSPKLIMGVYEICEIEDTVWVPVNLVFKSAGIDSFFLSHWALKGMGIFVSLQSRDCLGFKRMWHLIRFSLEDVVSFNHEILFGVCIVSSGYDIVLMGLYFVGYGMLDSDRLCESHHDGWVVRVIFIEWNRWSVWSHVYTHFHSSILLTVREVFLYQRVVWVGLVRFSWYRLSWLFCWWFIMSQLSLNKGKAPLVRTETVRIANSVLAQRIQQFSLTLIGRLMNPSVQQMESLVANLPKIWKLEDKVVGEDLGQGLFQFNFEVEEELQAVLMNGPYHFDGWMISLVKWEPIISSTYPSAINFWVKVTGIPMHLWEEATLRAIGKKVGILREIDEETGSFCVTVNGFNPLLFKMVVPFESGDEIIVSLEYEKLTGFCDHCSRLTHDVRVCPELQKGAAEQAVEQQSDKRFGQKHHLQGKQGGFKNEGGWEKPRKHVKRALDFQSQDAMIGDVGTHGPRFQDMTQGSSWGQKKQFTTADSSGSGGQRGSQLFGGSSMGQSSSFPLNRKGMGPVWPKPLYKVKQGVAAKSSQEEDCDVRLASTSRVAVVVPDAAHNGSLKEGEETDFMEENDDLLEEGEYPEGDVAALVETEPGKEDVSLSDQGADTQAETTGSPQGAGKKQKTQGRQVSTLYGKPADGGRQVKKGTVALPKPPAET